MRELIRQWAEEANSHLVVSQHKLWAIGLRVQVSNPATCKNTQVRHSRSQYALKSPPPVPVNIKALLRF